jgi:hypothetical protein
MNWNMMRTFINGRIEGYCKDGKKFRRFPLFAVEISFLLA